MIHEERSLKKMQIICRRSTATPSTTLETSIPAWKERWNTQRPFLEPLPTDLVVRRKTAGEIPPPLPGRIAAAPPPPATTPASAAVTSSYTTPPPPPATTPAAAAPVPLPLASASSSSSSSSVVDPASLLIKTISAGAAGATQGSSLLLAKVAKILVLLFELFFQVTTKICTISLLPLSSRTRTGATLR